MFKLCWVIFGIFYTAGAVLKISQHDGKNKLVNLALETILEFDKRDKQADVKLLNEVQNFVSKVKKVVAHKNAERRHLTEENKKPFSNFLIKLIKVLNEYEDNDLETFILIVSKEMKNYNYTGCKFHEVSENIVMEKIRDTLTKLNNEPADYIRHFLESLENKISNENYAENEKQIVDTMNSIYGENSDEKFNQFLANVNDYRLQARKNMDLSAIISNGLRAVLFDHYTHLDAYLRSTLVTSLQEYVNHYYDKDVQKIKDRQSAAANSMLRSKKQRQEQHIKNAYDNWVHNLKMKTKTKPDTETTKKATKFYLQINDFKSEEQDRNYKYISEVKSNEMRTPSYKKRGIRTTEQPRTWRQMYVEKNLDLKYDPDAYENLTTVEPRKVKRIRQHKSSAIDPLRHPHPTTTIKNSYERNIHEKRKKYYKKRHPVEEHDSNSDEDSNSKELYHKKSIGHRKPEVDFYLQRDETSKRHTSSTTAIRHKSKPAKIIRNNYKYVTKPKHERKIKNMTFKTLYPTFIIEWTVTTPRKVKRKGQQTVKHRKRIHHRGSKENKELYTFEEGHPNVIKLVEDIDLAIEVKKGKELHSFDMKPSFNKHNEKHQRKDNSRTSVEQKNNRRDSANIPVSVRPDKGSESEKHKTIRDPLILPMQYGIPHTNGRRQYRRQYAQPPIISEEGLSIEGFRGVNHKKVNNENNNTAASDGSHRYFLKRLEKLENELELVKFHIKNDKHLFLNLNNTPLNKVNEVSAPNSYGGIKSSPQSPLDNKITSNTSNTDGSNKNIQETFKNDNYTATRQALDLKNENMMNIVPLQKGLTNYKKIQGRKTFVYSKNVQEKRSDRGEVFTISQDSHLKNNKGIKYNNVPLKLDSNEKEINSKKSLYYELNGEKRNEKNITVSLNDAGKMEYNAKISPFVNDIVDNKSKNKSRESVTNVLVADKQFKTIHNDNQIKDNALKEHLKSRTRAEIQLLLNSSEELMSIPKVYTITSEFNDSLKVEERNHDDLAKVNEKLKTKNIIASDNTSSKSPTNVSTAAGSRTMPVKLVQEVAKEVGGMKLTDNNNLEQGESVRDPNLRLNNANENLSQPEISTTPNVSMLST